MNVLINTLMFCCFSTAFLTKESTNICPVEDGEVIPSLAAFVRGEGHSLGLTIISSENSNVYSLSNGRISFIGERSKTLRVIDQDMVYKYFGVNTQLKKGDEVKKGIPIGTLYDRFLVLNMWQEDQEIDPRKHIHCLKD